MTWSYCHPTCLSCSKKEASRTDSPSGCSSFPALPLLLMPSTPFCHLALSQLCMNSKKGSSQSPLPASHSNLQSRTKQSPPSHILRLRVEMHFVCMGIALLSSSSSAHIGISKPSKNVLYLSLWCCCSVYAAKVIFSLLFFFFYRFSNNLCADHFMKRKE